MNFSLTKAINKIHFTYLKYYKLNDRFEDKMKKNGVYYIYIDNKNNKKKINYPDFIPTDKEVNYIEYNKTEYYIDKFDNVFLIGNEDSVGAFYGVYDRNSETILTIDE